MAFDLRPTEGVLLWPGNANIAFDLRPTKDVLPWPDNANIAFDLRPTEDVLPWPGNANMAFALRPTKDVLPWPAQWGHGGVVAPCLHAYVSNGSRYDKRADIRCVEVKGLISFFEEFRDMGLSKAINDAKEIAVEMDIDLV
ncbi:hypothetical protein Tco_0976504 [Tanacetum coccineum]|uniref:Uncharacterized protein n=1 Tax=Tanacetum coccineum TaxID=301880 RepID=A0ABQ5EHV9_9ASTR